MSAKRNFYHAVCQIRSTYLDFLPTDPNQEVDDSLSLFAFVRKISKNRQWGQEPKQAWQPNDAKVLTSSNNVL